MIEILSGFGADVQSAFSLLLHSFAVPPMAKIASELLQYSFGTILKTSDCSRVVAAGDCVNTRVDGDAADTLSGGNGGGEAGSSGLNVEPYT